MLGGGASARGELVCKNEQKRKKTKKKLEVFFFFFHFFCLVFSLFFSLSFVSPLQKNNQPEKMSTPVKSPNALEMQTIKEQQMTPGE